MTQISDSFWCFKFSFKEEFCLSDKLVIKAFTSLSVLAWEINWFTVEVHFRLLKADLVTFLMIRV